MRVLAPERIMVVSPSNTAPEITVDGGTPFYARTSYNDAVQGEAVALFLHRHLRAREVVVLSDRGSYGRSIAARFTERFRSLGGNVVAIDVAPQRASPIRRELADVGETDAVFLAVSTPRAGAMVLRAVRSLPTLDGADLVAANAVFTPRFIEAAGRSAALGVHVAVPDPSPTPAGREFRLETNDRYDAYVDRYEVRFDEEPRSFLHAHAYDAANVILDAIETVAIEEKGSLLVPRVALRDAILATKSHEGVTGAIACTPSGECAAPIEVCMYRIVSGNIDESTTCLEVG